MDDRTIWGMFFLTIYGWQFHPGSNRDGTPLTMEECAQLADRMLEQYRRRFGWPS